MFPIRLCPSIRKQAASIAQDEGISLNYFISLAIAEKMRRMEDSLLSDDQQTSMGAGPAEVPLRRSVSSN